MAIKDGLLAEFDKEMASTRTVLERIPTEKFGWKPHTKSGTMGWLASHIANMGQWAAMTMNSDSFDMAPPGGETPKPPPEPKTSAELLQAFDANVKSGREAITQASDADMQRPWAFMNGGKTVFSMPKIAVLRGIIMNHLIHHRGQLTVYLRLNDIPVPALYGPSADESGSF